MEAVWNWIESNPAFVIGFFGLIITGMNVLFSNRRENQKMAKELFVEFNTRYDLLNSKLESFVSGEQKSKEQKGTRADVIDYFNLCAEQYHWKKKKRIDKDIWNSWQAGMNYWYSHETIKSIWKDEVKTRDGELSYYLKPGESFFKD